MKKSIISAVSALVGVGISRKIMRKSYEKSEKMSYKHLVLFLMMNQWVRLKQKGINIAEYFKKVGFYKIAVYGMSYVGETLLEELKGTEIEVVYGIDVKKDITGINVKIFSMDDFLEEVDAVIVTAITYFDEIQDKLSEKLNCPIVSLEDIILYEDYMGEVQNG